MVLVGSQLNGTLSHTMSDTARLIIHFPPVVSNYPAVMTFLEGRTAVLPLTVTGQGGDTLTYQWYKGPFALADTGDYHGTHTPTLTIDPIMAVDEAAYAFTAISQLNGTRTSGGGYIGQVSVITAPVITMQPISHSVSTGSNIYIGVSVSYAPYGFHYQWQKDTTDLQDGGRISNATTPDLIIYNATPADAGNYRVKISSVLGNDSLMTISAYAVISVN
jgi:hypothetical protein